MDIILKVHLSGGAQLEEGGKRQSLLEATQIELAFLNSMT
jgi:hypothetical protein